ncbi:hypothetical protein Q4F19_15110 [Sphingomonas sp. BIUV-7]|uniref:PRC-barrel domain-containing protein n=1 Tax=Sphingomonas natans TaxID=3063330 RepID=A0ABT8YBK3_9SPHN|nr:hypothetical protein [Sphingomonas sp. BIUV-7]MDO6415718.1 hypothetical protein [Sphingomonas sp. BIUV-7]
MFRKLILMSGAALLAAPALAQTAAPADATAAPAAAATPGAGVVAGAKVVDTAGADVGTIESIANGTAVLSTGAAKVSVPATSFAKGPTALVFGMTKADIEAKVAQATSAPVEITVGAVVSDPSGAKVGTVKEVAADGVTVASETAMAKLPKASFAKGASGLVIAMTPAQFDAAAKAAGGTKPTPSAS